MRVLLLWSLLVKLISGVCNWPDAFANTVYEDSSKGEITFQTDTLTGWTIKITGSRVSLDAWKCHSMALYESDNILVMITESAFELFAQQFYGYICLRLTEITPSSYRYYLSNVVQTNVDNERVAISTENNLEDWGTLCLLDDASLLPEVSEYRVLLRSDNVASAKIDFPYVFLGSYHYTHTSSDGTVTCDSSSSSLSTCTESISFDYNTCSTKVAYSVSDSVWCVDTVPSGGNNYITVYNGNDADSDIDNTNVYRFSCIAMSADGTMASVAPNSCRKDQTPDALPTQNGLNIGCILSLTKTTESCPTCPVVTAPDSGTVSYSTNGATTTASYTCSSQYSLAGPESRACQSDHSWADEDPTCTCIVPATPSNGSFTVAVDGTLTYSCDVGFVLNGARTRICQKISNTWSGVEPACVSSASSSESSSGGNNLLPAVIVLAILVVCLGIAFGLSVFYIWKLKKNALGNDKKSNQNGTFYNFPASKAPMDHTQHIMDPRHTSSAMSAPRSHHPSPRMDSTTPRSLSTTVSSTSLHLSHLNLIREDTTSSVILDQNNPAPWTKRPRHEHGTSLSTGTFPPITESRTSLISPRTNNNTGHPRKKKQSLTEKMQRQNSVNAGETDVSDKDQGQSRLVKAESVKSMSREKVIVNRNGSIPTTVRTAGSGSITVPKLNLSEQPVRASTPVNHQIEVRDSDKCRTPRSNEYATVQ